MIHKHEIPIRVLMIILRPGDYADTWESFNCRLGVSFRRKSNVNAGLARKWRVCLATKTYPFSYDLQWGGDLVKLKLDQLQLNTLIGWSVMRGKTTLTGILWRFANMKELLISTRALRDEGASYHYVAHPAIDMNVNKSLKAENLKTKTLMKRSWLHDWWFL